MQADSSPKHTARVKPSQYIAQHIYEQTSKSNCSSCSSQTSYLTQPRSSKVFTVACLVLAVQCVCTQILQHYWSACAFQQINACYCFSFLCTYHIPTLVYNSVAHANGSKELTNHRLRPFELWSKLSSNRDGLDFEWDLTMDWILEEFSFTIPFQSSTGLAQKIFVELTWKETIVNKFRFSVLKD